MAFLIYKCLPCGLINKKPFLNFFKTPTLRLTVLRSTLCIKKNLKKLFTNMKLKKLRSFSVHVWCS